MPPNTALASIHGLHGHEAASGGQGPLPPAPPLPLLLLQQLLQQQPGGHQPPPGGQPPGGHHPPGGHGGRLQLGGHGGRLQLGGHEGGVQLGGHQLPGGHLGGHQPPPPGGHQPPGGQPGGHQPPPGGVVQGGHLRMQPLGRIVVEPLPQLLELGLVANIELSSVLCKICVDRKGVLWKRLFGSVMPYYANNGQVVRKILLGNHVCHAAK